MIMELVIILSTKLFCLMFVFLASGWRLRMLAGLEHLAAGGSVAACDSVRYRVREPEQFHRGIPNSVRMHARPLF